MALSVEKAFSLFTRHGDKLSTARFFFETERHTVEATTGLTDCLTGWCDDVIVGRHTTVYKCMDGSRVVHSHDSNVFEFFDVGTNQFIGYLMIKIITLPEIES